jgi:outer membrane receptor protein involved in Fe transport
VPLHCGFTIVGNAGKAEVKGLELDVQARAGSNIDLGLSVGYIDATLAEDAPTLGGVRGDHLPTVPKWTVSANAQISFDLVGHEAYIRGDYTYTDGSYYGFNTSDPTSLKADVSLFNLRLGIDIRGWELVLYSKNLFNESRLGQCRLEPSFREIQPDLSTCVIMPRRIGVSVTKWFG